MKLNKLVYRLVPKSVDEVEFWRLYFCHAYHAVRSASSGQKSGAAVLTKAVLLAGDDTTSNSIIAAFQGDDIFSTFAQKEMEGILQRDAEDDEKLAEGIQMAVQKGVVEASPAVEEVCRIDVLGKSAEVVAADIIARLGDAPSTGCVLVLQGLSGTGKGTTVSKLETLLPRSVSWSNGNVFRSITLLAVSYCELEGAHSRAPGDADGLPAFRQV
ncbi:unnamed protein product [Polarella glacialis]|uniref:BSD domain-containing protein n=1 Tax=Polarella glacialis TaxID=89957 RepID=A0A813FL06_POLGL|nr:unnamed protein product [Polarella glacialis]